MHSEAQVESLPMPAAVPLCSAKKSRKKVNHGMPFGEPDGQRTGIEESFISFDNHGGWGGIATGETDFAARLLVGRKGSGKTVYLRRLRASAADNASQYADEVQYQPPATETVLSFARLFSTDESQLEWWATLWSRCVLRSLASHVMASDLASHVSPRIREKLDEFTQSNRGKLLREFVAPVSAYRQMDEIVGDHHSRNSIVEYLQNRYWSDLEGILGTVLQNSPPVFMFLDALDEHFERSPHWWLKCQEGLFNHAVQLLRSSQWNRLHLTISLRDIVYASIMRSEHRTRFAGDSHVRLLNWNADSIEEFLRMKLDRLHRRYFVNQAKYGKTVAGWLGLNTIANPKRNVQEPGLQYLLRHTRLLPRDVVIVGNRICALIERVQPACAAEVEPEIRKQVHEVASLLGREQFRICANELVSAYMPRSGEECCRDEFVGNEDFTSTVAMDLQDVVRAIGVDRVSRAVLEEAGNRASAQFECDIFSVLWRNGLIGCVDGPTHDEKHIFYDHDSLNSFGLPSEYNEYVFHPIVIDATGIQSIGSQPIVPYL